MSVLCSIASFLWHSHITSQMLLRSNFKSFGHTYLFMKPDSKAILFLLNFEKKNHINPTCDISMVYVKMKKERKEKTIHLKKYIVSTKIILCNKALVLFIY